MESLPKALLLNWQQSCNIWRLGFHTAARVLDVSIIVHPFPIVLAATRQGEGILTSALA